MGGLLGLGLQLSPTTYGGQCALGQKTEHGLPPVESPGERRRRTGVPLFLKNRDLLDRFRRGEQDALGEVYERYVDEVGMLARRGFTMEAHGHVVVPGARDVDAEHDLVQETFVKAFAEKARQSFDGLRP